MKETVIGTCKFCGQTKSVSVDALVDEVVSKVTMSLKSGGSCKLKYKDITCIEVLREEKHVARRSN